MFHGTNEKAINVITSVTEWKQAVSVWEHRCIQTHRCDRFRVSVPLSHFLSARRVPDLDEVIFATSEHVPGMSSFRPRVSFFINILPLRRENRIPVPTTSCVQHSDWFHRLCVDYVYIWVWAWADDKLSVGTVAARESVTLLGHLI